MNPILRELAKWNVQIFGLVMPHFSNNSFPSEKLSQAVSLSVLLPPPSGCDIFFEWSLRTYFYLVLKVNFLPSDVDEG